ncbi:MAG: hypothetical protein ACK4E7_13280 [Permianibacter sp.]
MSKTIRAPFCRVIVLLCSAAMGMLSGCGDSGGSGSGTGGDPVATAPTVTVQTLQVSATSLVVPLTNGSGVHVADVPVTLHSEDGVLYATRWGSTPDKIELAYPTSGATLAGYGSDLLAVYVDIASNEIRARQSTDGGRTWEPAVSLGIRPTGPALPTACLFRQRGQLLRVAAWSAQPSQSQGPLVVARHDGMSWQAPVSNPVDSSGAALQCVNDVEPMIVWRDHRDGNTGSNVALYAATLNSASQLLDEQLVVKPGFDPSHCADDGFSYVGYHTGTNDAHLRRSDDDFRTSSELDLDTNTAGTQPLDDSGKFVSVACGGGLIAAVWGDWPTKDEADAVASTRKLGMVVSRDWGATWASLRPAGEDEEQGPATVAVAGDRVYLMWRAPGAVKLATVSWP